MVSRHTISLIQFGETPRTQVLSIAEPSGGVPEETEPEPKATAPRAFATTATAGRHDQLLTHQLIQALPPPALHLSIRHLKKQIRFQKENRHAIGPFLLDTSHRLLDRRK